MIEKFYHKGLGKFYESGDKSGINADHVKKIHRVLSILETAVRPEDLNIPGFKLHELIGDRKGQWAVSISANLRLVFEFDGTTPTNVDLVDYH